jgi:hypothetical protein
LDVADDVSLQKVGEAGSSCFTREDSSLDYRGKGFAYSGNCPERRQLKLQVVAESGLEEAPGQSSISIYAAIPEIGPNAAQTFRTCKFQFSDETARAVCIG